MTRLIAAETLKLRTTRTFAGLALGAVAVVSLITALTALAAAPGADVGRETLVVAGIAHAFALVLGVLAVTTELRHGSLTPALLVTPDRRRLLVAKLAAHTATAFALGLVAFGLAAAIGLPLLSANDVDSGLEAVDVAGIVAGGALGAALFAGLGVGLGALIGNQVGAIIAALGWLYAIEPAVSAIPSLGDEVKRFGLAGVSGGVSDTGTYDSGVTLLAQAPAGLLLAAYALAFVAAGAAVLPRRDIDG